MWAHEFHNNKISTLTKQFSHETRSSFHGCRVSVMFDQQKN